MPPPKFPFLEQIGDITVSFASLELSIQILVGSLIREHQTIGQIITAELSFQNLRALTISLYKERHGKDADFDTLRDLMKRARQIEEKRNQITHSFWTAGKSADTITRVKATAKEAHGIRFQFHETSETDLAGIATDIKQLTEEVQAFLISLIKSGKAINNPLKKLW